MFACCASGAETKADAAEVVDTPPADELPAEAAEGVKSEGVKSAKEDAVQVEPSAEAAPAPKGQVGVKLHGSHGMVIDYWTDRLQVVKIEDNGSAKAYNDSAADDTKIAPHDFIVKVNEASDFEEMRKLLKSGQELVVHFAKPVSQIVTIDKGSASLGMKLIFQKERSTCLRVTGITEKGKADEYNASCTSDEAKIQPGDFIATVNSTSGSASDLFDALKQGGKVEMTMLRWNQAA